MQELFSFNLYGQLHQLLGLGSSFQAAQGLKCPLFSNHRDSHPPRRLAGMNLAASLPPSGITGLNHMGGTLPGTKVPGRFSTMTSVVCPHFVK